MQRDSCLAIIPNACSAKLQPLHQGVKEKFKVSSALLSAVQAVQKMLERLVQEISEKFKVTVILLIN